MVVTEQGFLDTIDKWMRDVRHEALALFRAGVAHDHCVNVAMKLVEGKDVAQARRLHTMGIAAPPAGLLS